MNELALFAGAGGGILGGQLLGWRTICAVEWSEFPRETLLRRQRDGALPQFPVWDDVQTFDGRSWAGLVDVVSGGFPCQDISAAGKGAGIDGERSGMWTHMARIIGEVRPRFAFVENSPMLTSRGLGRVLGDLAEMGFDAEWGVLGAIDAGAPHIRERIWIVAHNPSAGWGAWRARRPDPSGSRERERALQEPADLANTDSELLDRSRTPGTARRLELADGGEVLDAGCKDVEGQWPQPQRACAQFSDACNASWWSAEPRLGRVAHGVAHRVDRLRAIGNGQVPAVAAMAFRELSRRIRGH
jgi:DNA (cytosine-5)-methyltransferase 1